MAQAHAAAHRGPNYMTIFLLLFVMTVVEIAVIFMGFPKLFLVVLLVSLALAKAGLVAAYFMHLALEVRTLAAIAVTPLVIGALLIVLLMPDHVGIGRQTAESAKIAAPKH